MIALAAFFMYLFIAIILGVIYWYITIPKNLPPGPISLPFVGYSIDFLAGLEQPLVLQRLIKKYGPLIKLYVADKLVIILGNYDTIHEALVKQDDIFAGRPLVSTFIPDRIFSHGIIFTEGELWKKHRRFALSTLRHFGMGRPILEAKIKAEVGHLCQCFAQYSSSGMAFNPDKLVTFLISNTISQLVFGRRFDYDDKEVARLFSTLSERESGAGIGFLTPFLLSERMSSLLSCLPMMKEGQKPVNNFLDFTQREMMKTKATYDQNSEPSNYIHAYMKIANGGQDDSFTDTQLLATVFELLLAGTDTTAKTICFGILFLAHHPDIQEDMYTEIRDRLGISCLPNYADKKKLPFVEAVIAETQRLANLAPFSLPRRTVASTKLMGYDIPKHAIIIPFLTNVHHNPEVFRDPQNFDPYRFMDSDAKFVRDPKVMPFMAGKRICLGESLARMELFLVFVCLVSQFRFCFPNVRKKPSMTPCFGFNNTHVPYKICLEARDN